jgi:hypothetical protein
MIWQANVDILEHEQRDIVHPVLYNGAKNEALWKLISKSDDTLDILINSPVPGEARQFRDCLPNGNLARFEDRWKWCTEHIMPAWKELETRHPQRVRTLIKNITA